jgi:hypothetical protein
MFIYQRQVPLLRTSSCSIMSLFEQKHKQYHATITIIMTQFESAPTKKRDSYYELFGWLGTGLIISSYSLLSTGVISGSDYTYHIMVLIGSLGVAIISYLRKIYQPLVINAFFVAIAIIALIRITYSP